jgi:hypothetical protein
VNSYDRELRTAQHDARQAGRGQAPRRRRLTKATLVGIALWAALPLIHFGYGTYELYGYGLGTPTTATVVSCRAPRTRGAGIFGVLSSHNCRATWKIGAESHTGPIEGPKSGYDVHSSVDVRVLGNTAFTPAGIAWQFVAGVIAIGLFPIPFLLFWLFLKLLQLFMPKSRGGG